MQRQAINILHNFQKRKICVEPTYMGNKRTEAQNNLIMSLKNLKCFNTISLKYE